MRELRCCFIRKNSLAVSNGADNVGKTSGAPTSYVNIWSAVVNRGSQLAGKEVIYDFAKPSNTYSERQGSE